MMYGAKQQHGMTAINPQTGRPVTVGGRVWKRLVKKGVLDGTGYENPNTYYVQDSGAYEDPEAARTALEEQKAILNTKGNFPRGTHAVIKGNKLIGQRAKLTTNEASHQTANAAVNVIDDIQNGRVEIPQNMSRDQAHEYLQSIIFNKMLSQNKKFRNTRLAPTGQPKAKPKARSRGRPRRGTRAKRGKRRQLNLAPRPQPSEGYGYAEPGDNEPEGWDEDPQPIAGQYQDWPHDSDQLETVEEDDYTVEEEEEEDDTYA